MFVSKAAQRNLQISGQAKLRVRRRHLIRSVKVHCRAQLALRATAKCEHFLHSGARADIQSDVPLQRAVRHKLFRIRIHEEIQLCLEIRREADLCIARHRADRKRITVIHANICAQRDAAVCPVNFGVIIIPAFGKAHDRKAGIKAPRAADRCRLAS